MRRLLVTALALAGLFQLSVVIFVVVMIPWWLEAPPPSYLLWMALGLVALEAARRFIRDACKKLAAELAKGAGEAGRG